LVLPGGRVAGGLRALLPVAEAVEEAAEDAAFAGKGRAGRGRDRALCGDGLIVVRARDGVDDLGFAEVLGAFDLGHVADEQAVAHDLGLQAGCAVGVPFSVAAAGQAHADAELAGAPAQQVSVDATVTQGVGDPAGPEFVHARKIALVPERSLTAG
jgi:hypothetical protein